MTISEQLFSQAQHSIPGGVNSPVRAFKAVGGTPRFIEKADGPYIWDVDGKRYIDYVLSWGPMVMGHNHPKIREAVINAAQGGLSFGAPTRIEIELAEKIKSLIPSIEKIRMVSSGTEATMSAIRLARGYSKRNKIVKFEGCYHGHSDSLLVKAGSGALTFGVPSSPGVPDGLADHTITLEFNNIEQVKQAFAEVGEDIACIIVEPVAGNMNCIPPVPGFLQGLREVCDKYQSVLIFDEVMTGFRVAKGGAQAKYGVTPDITALGKVIGGGMPVGAFGGKEDIMNYLAPMGPVYQAGTLSGNPVAMSAGLTAIEIISEAEFYEPIFAKTKQLVIGFEAVAKKHGIPLTSNSAGSMFGIFFSSESKITNYSQATAINQQQFNQFFHKMLELGVYMAPASFEAGFMSATHSSADIQATLDAADKAFASL